MRGSNCGQQQRLCLHCSVACCAVSNMCVCVCMCRMAAAHAKELELLRVDKVCVRVSVFVCV
jgi:hypothetical protein